MEQPYVDAFPCEILLVRLPWHFAEVGARWRWFGLVRLGRWLRRGSRNTRVGGQKPVLKVLGGSLEVITTKVAQ